MRSGAAAGQLRRVWNPSPGKPFNEIHRHKTHRLRHTAATPVTSDSAIIEPAAMQVRLLAAQLRGARPRSSASATSVRAEVLNFGTRKQRVGRLDVRHG